MLRVLFIARAFPPAEYRGGGIEKHNQALAQALRAVVQLRLIVNRRGRRFLPLFLPFAWLKAACLVRHCDVVLLGDGVLGVVGWLLKRLSDKPVVCVLHGLDVTYSNGVYQRLYLRLFLPALDRYIAVSQATRREGERRGLAADKWRVIGNGVDTEIDARGDAGMDTGTDAAARQYLYEQFAIPIEGRLILSLGRLVERKGVAWFIAQVLPRLRRRSETRYVYVVAGDGPARRAVKQAIEQASELVPASGGTTPPVVWVGAVSEADKARLMAAAHIFVQPNIPVAHDMEGFGMVVLEAAMYRCAVVAARLEGLQDAIQSGQNGVLVAPRDAAAFCEVIAEWLQDDTARHQFAAHARAYVQHNFSWQQIGQEYCRALNVCY